MAPFTVQQTLQQLPLRIAMDVIEFFRAALVRFSVDMLFGNRPDWFTTHPSNLLTYQALVATEQASIVRIYSALNHKEGAKGLTLPAGLRRKLDLGHHRHFITHPFMGTEDWGDPAMKEFAKQRRGETDLRAALVLDLVRSIEEERAAHGVTEYPMDLDRVDVNIEMAELHRLILGFCLKPGTEIPTREDSTKGLQILRARWMALLAERPDGKRNAS